MKNLRKINKYIPFFKAGIKTFLVYKAQTFMWLFISVVEIFFVFFLYQAIYKNNVDIYADSFNWDKQVCCAYMLRDIVNS